MGKKEIGYTLMDQELKLKMNHKSTRRKHGKFFYNLGVGMLF